MPTRSDAASLPALPPLRQRLRRQCRTRNESCATHMSPLLQTGITGDASYHKANVTQRSGAEFRVRCSGNLLSGRYPVLHGVRHTISSSPAPQYSAKACGIHPSSPFGSRQRALNFYPSRLSLYRCDAVPAARRAGLQCHTARVSATHKVGAGLPPGARLPPVLCSLRRDWVSAHRLVGCLS